MEEGRLRAGEHMRRRKTESRIKTKDKKEVEAMERG